MGLALRPRVRKPELQVQEYSLKGHALPMGPMGVLWAEGPMDPHGPMHEAPMREAPWAVELIVPLVLVPGANYGSVLFRWFEK